MKTETVKSGLASLDEVIQGLRYGDNVVWQVDHLEEYKYFAEPFASQAIADGRKCIYLRFAPHIEILKARPGLTIIELDPEVGFDTFSREVNKIIESFGREIFYIFDNLSFLVVRWATDELLANFFQVTCPYLFELETVAYFALTRGQHSHSAVARIRDTTQLLIDVYQVQDIMYLHPLKVWDRYSPKMFLPHMMSEHRLGSCLSKRGGCCSIGKCQQKAAPHHGKIDSPVGKRIQKTPAIPGSGKRLIGNDT